MLMIPAHRARFSEKHQQTLVTGVEGVAPFCALCRFGVCGRAQSAPNLCLRHHAAYQPGAGP